MLKTCFIRACQHPANVDARVPPAEESQGGGSQRATSRAPLRWRHWHARVIGGDSPSPVRLGDKAGWKGATEVPSGHFGQAVLLVERSWEVCFYP